MGWIRSIVHEIYGLFVDDGSFALALLVWMIVACAGSRLLHAGRWGGPVLVAGLVALLAENALRASRKVSYRADERSDASEREEQAVPNRRRD